MKYLLTFSLFLFFSITASAQTDCDSVDVISVKYSPFTDTLIVVHVENNNPNEIFDYPGFVLLDSNGDTLAKETVNYFGIGGESIHTLEVRDGVHDPLNDFLGSMELHTNFYDVLACSWNLNQSLCADEPCDSMIIGLQNWGGALVIGDFTWQVDDEDGMLVDSGSFTMEAQGQFWSQGLCVPAGNYTYNLTALTQPSGGGPNMTVTSSSNFSASMISMPFDWFNQVGSDMDVPFYSFCAESPNSVESVIKEQHVQLIFNALTNTLLCNELMSSFNVYSASGQLVFTDTPRMNSVSVPKLSPGMYVALVKTEKGEATIKFILE